MIRRVLVISQFLTREFVGKPFPTECPDKYRARFSEVDHDMPNLGTCWLMPDENGNAQIVAHNWDSSD